MPAMSNPSALSGITILEVSRLLPGSLCTQLLADLGAEVIKIEQPVVGDYQRDFPPRAVKDSGSFLLCNRNKRSITVNFKSAAGKDIMKRLAGRADVLIEGFRPGVMDRLGLGYETLREINPGLIFCALSGYGQTGPYRLLPGHDMNYLGVVGALQLSSRADTGPIIPGMLIADIGGGTLTAAFGILAALMARSRTGRGQFVDVSMTDGAMTWMTSHAASYLFGGVEPRGGEERNIGGAPCYNIYRCQDGRYITLGSIEAHFWERFCDLVERPDLKGDAFPATQEAAEEVRQNLAAVFLTKPGEEWVRLLNEHDIPVGPINSFEEAFADPQMRARDMLQYIDHPVEGRIPQIGFPVKFSETPGEMRLPPPVLGQHTDEILREIGYAETDIEVMRNSGDV